MKKTLTTLMLFLAFIPRARADLFGGDVAVLTQILANAVSQLQQLKDIVKEGREHLELIEEINRGINETIRIGRTIDPDFDPGIFRKWNKISDAAEEIRKIYGRVPISQDTEVQKNSDQVVAEAITTHNSLLQQAKRLHELSERIKEHSHKTSPGGAQKLIAESQALLLQAANQQVRAQAMTLKTLSVDLASRNKKEKDITRDKANLHKGLGEALKSKKLDFKLPRF